MRQGNVMRAEQIVERLHQPTRMPHFNRPTQIRGQLGQHGGQAVKVFGGKGWRELKQ